MLSIVVVGEEGGIKPICYGVCSPPPPHCWRQEFKVVVLFIFAGLPAQSNDCSYKRSSIIVDVHQSLDDVEYLDGVTNNCLFS